MKVHKAMSTSCYGMYWQISAMQPLLLKFIIISVAHCRLDFTINSSIAYKFKNTSAILNVDTTEITTVNETRECLSRQMMFNLFSLVM